MNNLPIEDLYQQYLLGFLKDSEQLIETAVLSYEEYKETIEN